MPPSALTASMNTSFPAVSGLPITATGPVNGVSTPSLIVLPSKPGTSVTSPPPPPVVVVVGASTRGDAERQRKRGQHGNPSMDLHGTLLPFEHFLSS